MYEVYDRVEVEVKDQFILNLNLTPFLVELFDAGIKCPLQFVED
jgi:hypothetical protein